MKHMRKQNGKRLIFVSRLLFIIYLMILLFFVFISDREVYDNYRYNLTLFKEIKRFWNYGWKVGTEAMLLNLIGNVLVFLPIGFFLPLSHNFWKNMLTATLTGYLVSLAIETTQLYFKIGVFDVDDLLLNTIGALLGYWLYAGIRKIKRICTTDK